MRVVEEADLPRFLPTQLLWGLYAFLLCSAGFSRTFFEGFGVVLSPPKSPDRLYSMSPEVSCPPPPLWGVSPGVGSRLSLPPGNGQVRTRPRPRASNSKSHPVVASISRSTEGN